ncbi:MAG: TRAP transporter large permease subunit [Candidatus Neomarinimicrobiota bacterium]
MLPEAIILLSMLTVFAVSVFVLKLPAGVSLMAAALIGALAGGEGIPIRHLVEGSFGFLEAILIIATAMIFMKVAEASGVLSTISYWMIKSFYKSPSLLFVVIALFIMFPGMLTGLSSACLLTTGALIVPALLAMGMPKLAAGSFVALMAVLGEIAPPICIPVMIIGGGVDMPYIGFTRPLFLASFPLAVVLALYYRYRYLNHFEIQAVLAKLPKPVYHKHGFKLFLPIIFVIAYLIVENLFPEKVLHIGVPLIFMIGALIGLLTGEKFAVPTVLRSAIRNAMPVMAILVGVGMFLQILTLTGARGWVAVNALKLPEEIKYLTAGLMPFFGSAYAAASVIGVPLVYVFIGKNEIVLTAGLALMAALGDLMPPPSMLFAYASQMVDVKNHYRILKASLIPIILCLVVGLIIIIYAEKIARIIL